MKIYNETKTELIENPDLTKGYLKVDEIIKHIPEQQAVEEKWHYEYINFSSGGQSRKKVVDVEGVNYIPAHIETEQIFVYCLYTQEELEKLKQENYEALIISKIRQKYTLDQELAILRQRETKPEEFAEYNNYVEECKVEAKKEFKNVK